MEEITTERNPIDSIEVSKNAKGEYAYKSKLYYDASLDSYVDVIDKLENIDALLKEKFG